MAVSMTSFSNMLSKFIRAEFMWTTPTTSNQQPIFRLKLARYLFINLVITDHGPYFMTEYRDFKVN